MTAAVSCTLYGINGPGLRMSQRRAYTPRDYEEEEGDTIPANTAPQPLPLDLGLAESHPLLDISLTPDKGGGILRRESSERRQGRRQVRFDVSVESENRGGDLKPDDGPLESPRMHSSIALQQEVRREAEQDFNAERAVQNELGRSYRVRRSVESEAVRALNVSRAQNLYQGLVSVEPPAEQIQRLTERQRRAEHRELPQIEGPDLFAFSDSFERFTETPYLGVEGLPALSLLPRHRPSHTAFDMFHKLGEWAS
ncbi:protein phosphatase 1 regulatory subunit 35 [Rhinophrynus dorsalis]